MTFKEAYKEFLEERREELDAIKNREDLLAYVKRTHKGGNDVLYLLTYMLLSIKLKEYDFFESQIEVTHFSERTEVEHALYFSLGSKPWALILYKRFSYPVKESLSFLEKDEDELKRDVENILFKDIDFFQRVVLCDYEDIIKEAFKYSPIKRKDIHY